MTNGNAPADVTLQALTVALSIQGIENFIKNLIPQVTQKSFSAPDQPNVLTDLDIPGYCATTLSLSISGGSVSSVSATLNSVTPKSGGVFTISLDAGFNVAYNAWHETGTITCPPVCTPGCPGTFTNFDQTLSDFWFAMNSITIGFDLTLQGAGGQWTAAVSNASQSGVTLGTVNMPSGTNLSSPFSCINDRINQGIQSAIADVNFAANIAAAINNIIAVIPTSGNLTSSIVYQFPPTFMNFPPDNSGLTTGVTGQVVNNGTPYPGAAVIIPPAGIDTSRDAVFNVGIYEFNALLWAFFTNGSIQITVTPNMLPDPRLLNTHFYQTLFPALYNFAPDADMHVNIAASAEPAVSNGNMYWITPSVLTALQSKLPASTFNTLSNSDMVNEMFPTLEMFNMSLSNTLTASDFNQFSAVIAKAAETIGMFTDTQLLVTVNVIKQNNPVFALSFSIEKQDLLGSLALGVQSGVQTLNFAFSEYNTSAAIVNSAIGDISAFELDVVWSIVDDKIDEKIQEAGTTGVALPSVSGFLIENAAITLQPNYVALAADVHFGTLATVAHRESKRKFEPAIPLHRMHRVPRPELELLLDGKKAESSAGSSTRVLHIQESEPGKYVVKEVGNDYIVVQKSSKTPLNILVVHTDDLEQYNSKK